MNNTAQIFWKNMVEFARLIDPEEILQFSRKDDPKIVKLSRYMKEELEEIEIFLLKKLTLDSFGIFLENAPPYTSLKGFLTLAAIYNKPKLVELLLQLPDIDANEIIDRTGRTPLYMTCARGNIETFKLLFNDIRVNSNPTSHWKGMTPFNKVCKEGHINIFKCLLQDSRIDVNAKNYEGMSPLHNASSYEYVEILESLLEDSRVDINAINYKGETAFYNACEKGHKEILKIFIKNPRIDVNQTNNSHLSPLYNACSREMDHDSSQIIAMLLLVPGIDIHISSIEGLKPSKLINDCIKNGQSELCEIRNFMRNEVFQIPPWNPFLRYYRPLKNRNKIINYLQSHEYWRVYIPLAQEIYSAHSHLHAAIPFALTVFLCDGYLRLKEERLLYGKKRFVEA